MNITPVTTGIITPKNKTIYEVIDESIDNLCENTIIVISSKIVSLCEDAVTPIDGTDKDNLVEQSADLFLDKDLVRPTRYTITQNTLIPVAGIDTSNGDGNYILWPKDPQESANKIRAYLQKRFEIENIGVIISDSTCTPLRRGVSGIFIAHSGFVALNSYFGKNDLFDKPLSLASKANVAQGIVAGAVMVMGECDERTPIAIVADIPNVTFQPFDPTEEELAELYPTIEEDLFAPFLQSVKWNNG